MTRIPPFFGCPQANARMLLADLQGKGVPATEAELTRFVNRGTLELYRSWHWATARQLCLAHLGRLTAPERLPLVDRHDVGSVLLNLCRLDMAVGDVDGALGWLEDLVSQADAGPVVCREAVNVAIGCGATGSARALLERVRPCPEQDLGVAHLDVLDGAVIEPAIPDDRPPKDHRASWAIEIRLLTAATGDDAASRDRLAAAIDILTAPGTGPPVITSWLALDRCARALGRIGCAGAMADVAKALARHTSISRAPALHLRAASWVIDTEGTFPDLGALLDASETLGLPRESAMFWRSLAASDMAPPGSRERACVLATAIELVPRPAEAPPSGTCYAGSGGHGWDGLTDDGRASLTALATALYRLVADDG